LAIRGFALGPHGGGWRTTVDRACLAGKRTPNEALELCYPNPDGKRCPVHIPANLYVVRPPKNRERVQRHSANPRPSAGMIRIRFKGFIAAGYIPKRRLSSFAEHPSVNSGHYVMAELSNAARRVQRMAASEQAVSARERRLWALLRRKAWMPDQVRHDWVGARRTWIVLVMPGHDGEVALSLIHI